MLNPRFRQERFIIQVNEWGAGFSELSGGWAKSVLSGRFAR